MARLAEEQIQEFYEQCYTPGADGDKYRRAFANTHPHDTQRDPNAYTNPTANTDSDGRGI